MHYIKRYNLWRPENLLRYSTTYLSYTVFLPLTFHLKFVITGVPKSGTTWLGKIFASMPKVYMQFEGSLSSYARRLQEEVLRNPGYDLHDAGTYSDLRIFKQLIVKRAYLSRKTLMGYKAPSLLPEPLKHFFPNARVAFIYRDGRDFIVSDAFHNIRKGRIQGDPSTEEFWEEAIMRRALFWKDKVMNVLPRFRSIYGDDLYEIRYEDLVKPEKGLQIIQELAGFFGLNPEYATRAWEANRFDKLSGGRDPGQEDRKSFFRKGISGDWQNYFTVKNMETFNNLAGDALSVLGYNDIRTDG